MKCLVVLTGILALAVVIADSRPTSTFTASGVCVRESHNRTIYLDAFRNEVIVNITDAAYLHHLECEDCQGCHGEKYYGFNERKVWVKEPCNGTFQVEYDKGKKEAIRLDASHHDVTVEVTSGPNVVGVTCLDCNGCQGSFGTRVEHYGDTIETRITRKQIWAKPPCQGNFKIDYLKAHCTNITLHGGNDGRMHTKHISKPCKNGNIFRMEMYPHTAEGHCEFGRDVYFHKDLIFYGNCTARFEVCEVAPYEEIDHSDHAMSDDDRKIAEYWAKKLQHKYKMSIMRHYGNSHDDDHGSEDDDYGGHDDDYGGHNDDHGSHNDDHGSHDDDL